MKDMVTNGTGNSRYLKTSLASGTTWETALAQLRAGTFPVDFNGINTGGITQQGSAYSKANVLPDDVCASLGIDRTTAEPKDAFASVASRSRPNLLKNAYFVGGGSQQGPGYFPINSNGQTSYSGAVHTIDQWRLWASDGTFTIHNGYIESTRALFQAVESGVLVGMKSAAGPITVSFLTSDNVLGVATSQYDRTNDKWSAGFNVGGWFDLSSTGTLAIQVDGVNITKFIAIKLELGDTQTLAHQENGEWVLNEIPDYNEELVRCMNTPSQIEAGSYVGTGTYGSSNPNSLTFEFAPKVVFIYPKEPSPHAAGVVAVYGTIYAIDYGTSRDISIIWSNKQMSWYSMSNPLCQFNDTDVKYIYVAIG